MPPAFAARPGLVLSLLLAAAAPAAIAQISIATDQPCGCRQWIDAKTGKPVSTIPAGIGHYEDFVPDPSLPHINSRSWNNGVDPDGVHAYNPKTGQNLVRTGPGEWIDAKTGKCVPTIPAGIGHYEDFVPDPSLPAIKSRSWDNGVNPDGIHAYNPKTGQNFVLLPCPPPAIKQPAPPPSTASNPAPIPPPNRTPTFSCLHFAVGGSVGISGHTTTYDDGYKMGGPGVYSHVQFAVDDNPSHMSPNLAISYISVKFGVTAPTNTSSRDDGESHLKFVGTVVGEVGFQVGKLPGGSPITIFVNGGPAFGVESSGASGTIEGTSYSYSDTEKMFGFTTGGGPRLTVSAHLTVFAEVDYLHLNETSFASPDGDYKLHETAVNGSVGVQWTFHK